MTKNEANRLLRVCSSARKCHFPFNDRTSTKPVSVADRDSLSNSRSNFWAGLLSGIFSPPLVVSAGETT